MARQKFEKSFNTFVKGLMTEASEINFPENYSLYEKNFELRRDGGRDRRKGMDLLYPLGVVLTSLVYPQETNDAAQASISFPQALLKALVIQGSSEDAAQASISFPQALLRLPLQQYSTYDHTQATVAFPQAVLRAPLVVVEPKEATSATVSFPSAVLRHALLKTEYNSDAAEASITFQEATLYAPD